MREVFPGVFEIRLHDGSDSHGVREISIFLIPARDRSLMIDTGFRLPECFRMLEEGLHSLHIPMDRLDIFLTHRHHDHCGLASEFQKRGARIFMNPEEERHPYDCLSYRPEKNSLPEQERVLRSAGISEEQSPEIWSAFQKVSERIERHEDWFLAITGFPYEEARAGEHFDYGDFHFRAIPLRGHTYGQLGLMEEEKKLFFTADQLIHGVSPIVATTYVGEGLLQAFFDSMEYVKKRCHSGWTILPSHGNRIENVSEEVDKTVFAYLEKTSRVKDCLEKQREEMCCRRLMELCYQAGEAPKDEAGLFLYKMTLTKTFSILEYLHDINFVSRRMQDGTYYWKLLEKE